MNKNKYMNNWAELGLIFLFCVIVITALGLLATNILCNNFNKMYNTQWETTELFFGGINQ